MALSCLAFIAIFINNYFAGAGTKLKEEQQPPSKPPSGAVKETFRIVKASLSDDLVKATQAVYQFELSGKDYAGYLSVSGNKGGYFPWTKISLQESPI